MTASSSAWWDQGATYCDLMRTPFWKLAPNAVKRVMRSRFVRLVFLLDMVVQLLLWGLELAVVAMAVTHDCGIVVTSYPSEEDHHRCEEYLDLIVALFSISSGFHFFLTGAFLVGKTFYVCVALLLGKQQGKERQPQLDNPFIDAADTEFVEQPVDSVSATPSTVRFSASVENIPPVDPAAPAAPQSTWTDTFCQWFTIESWSMAASRDVYEETAESVQALFIDLLVLTFINTSLSLIPAITHFFSTHHVSDITQYVGTICGEDQLSLCKLGVVGWRVMLILSAYLRQLVQMSFFILPGAVYHHLSFRAAKKTGWSRYMHRILIEVPLLEVLVDIPYMVITSLTAPSLAHHYVTKAGVELFTATQIVAICWNLMLVLMLLEVDVRLWRCFRTPEPEEFELQVPDHLSPSFHSSTSLAATMVPSAERRKRERWHHSLKSFYAPQAGSRRSRQTVISGLVSVAMLSAGHGSSYTYLILISLFRLYVLILMFVQRDGESNFDDLRAAGGGFGLLVDARDFTCALRAVLDGKEYPRKLRQYKGTMFRMYDTLAVSYRWQPEKKPIGREQGVNMSTWQMQKLLEGIEMSGCIYVWMDVLCIPQDGSQLQRTLLARMMAVYSSTASCLVLRSCELPGNRYHQRAWTLQEWCTCRSMMVATEEAFERGEESESSMENALRMRSMSNREVKMYNVTREWQLSRKDTVRPFWLYGKLNSTLSDDDFRVIWRDYVRLSSQLSCQEPLDKIRAVFPLLWNTPASSHYDLQKLVGEVWDRVLDLGLNQTASAMRSRSGVSDYSVLPIQEEERRGVEGPAPGQDNGSPQARQDLPGTTLSPFTSNERLKKFKDKQLADSHNSNSTAHSGSAGSHQNPTGMADALMLMHAMMLGNEVIKQSSGDDL